MRYYVVFFIIYEILVGFYFYNQYENKLDGLHQNTIKLVKHTLDTTVNTFELANDDFHSQHSYEISKLTNMANGSSENVRNKVQIKNCILWKACTYLIKMDTLYSDFMNQLNMMTI